MAPPTIKSPTNKWIPNGASLEPTEGNFYPEFSSGLIPVCLDPQDPVAGFQFTGRGESESDPNADFLRQAQACLKSLVEIADGADANSAKYLDNKATAKEFGQQTPKMKGFYVAASPTPSHHIIVGSEEWPDLDSGPSERRSECEAKVPLPQKPERPPVSPSITTALNNCVSRFKSNPSSHTPHQEALGQANTCVAKLGAKAKSEDRTASRNHARALVQYQRDLTAYREKMGRCETLMDALEDEDLPVE